MNAGFQFFSQQSFFVSDIFMENGDYFAPQELFRFMNKFLAGENL